MPFSALPKIQLVVFTLDNHSFALELAAVHRVVRAMEVTPLPHAPEIVLGIVNIQGELLPVINLRRRFRLPERELSPSDQLVIVNLPMQGASKKVALLVDAISGIKYVEKTKVMAATPLVSGLEYVQGIVKVDEDLILIHDLNRSLSLQEEQMLQNALVDYNTAAGQTVLSKLDTSKLDTSETDS